MTFRFGGGGIGGDAEMLRLTLKSLARVASEYAAALFTNTGNVGEGAVCEGGRWWV